MSRPIAGPARPEKPAEKELHTWLETQRLKSVDNLEAGARQIITLVSLFYSIIFAALALGKDSMEASAGYQIVLVPGTVAVFALLTAIIAALVVVLPLFGIRYNALKPAEERAAFERLLQLKVWGLRLSVIAFGIGLIAFAVLIGTMLYYR